MGDWYKKEVPQSVGLEEMFQNDQAFLRRYSLALALGPPRARSSALRQAALSIGQRPPKPNANLPGTEEPPTSKG